ncbi:MAG: Mur ligase family protein [Planctomycetota bacterium]|nr:Mur ligase family protein [Planctomycetota bacterium]
MPSPRLLRVLTALDALVDWERRDRRGMHVGLAPMTDLMERLGEPQRRFRVVHVTGTKGKGTTAALVAEALRRAGLRTGLYTSPHLHRVNERVRIDGIEVGDEELAVALEDAFRAREAAILESTAADEATWFDLVTAAAFLVFSRAECAWAVVEVGIGGRLDSTNVADGEVCVVTNIDLEHVQVLGPTHAAIAREKGGIVKRSSVLVTGVTGDPNSGPEADAAPVLEGIASALGVRVVRPARRAESLLDRNVDLARLVLDELGRRGVRGSDQELLSGSALGADAIGAARLAGRQELRRVGHTPVLLDGAHVASSITAVLHEAAADPRLPRKKPVVVLALGRDKDAPAILKALRDGVDRLLCTTAASGSLRAVETLVEESSRAGIGAETAADPASALTRAIQLAAAGETWVLVTGSFHLVGAVRLLLDAPSTDTDPRC